MRVRRVSLRTLIIIISTCIAIWGCVGPYTPTLETGTVAVLMKASSADILSDGPVSALTISPAVPTVAWYTVSFENGPAPKDPVDLSTDQAEFEIPVGSWNLVVSGFSSESVEVVSGSAPVEIVAGGRADVTIVLRPLATGVGSVDFLLTWPSSSIIDDVIAELDGVMIEDVYLTSTDTSVRFARIIAAGTYRLCVSLVHGEAPNRGLVSYVYEVVQVSGNVSSVKSIELTDADLNGPPAAPETASLQFESTYDPYWGTTTNELLLSWTDSAVTETAYVVERSVGDRVSFSDVATCQYNTTGFVMNDLIYGEPVYFRVRAVNVFGESYSSIVGYADVVPDSPSNEASVVTTSPQFGWTPNSAASQYVIEVSEFEGFNVVLATATIGDGTTWQAPDLGSGLRYWRVALVDSEGDRLVAISRASVTTLDIRVSDTNRYPQNLAVLSELPEMTWDPITGFGISSYEIQVADTEGGLEAATPIPVVQSSYLLPQVDENGDTFFWRVRGLENVNGQRTAWNSALSFSVSYPTGVSLIDEISHVLEVSIPQVPQIVSVHEGLTVTAEVNIPVDSYSWFLDGDLIEGETGAAISTGIGVGAGYHSLVVRVTDGNAIDSAEVRFFAALELIDGISPANGEVVFSRWPYLDWSDVTGAEYYRLDIALGTANFTYANQVGVTSTTSEYYWWDSIGYGDTCFWRVKAYREDGTIISMSDTHMFTVAPSSSITALSPADGSSTPVEQPELGWDEVPDIYCYEVQIAGSVDDLPGVIPVRVWTNHYTYSDGFSGYGDSIVWRVRPVWIDGRAAAWSESASLTYRAFIPGDTGPSGGVIVYDKGTASDGWRFVEAAPEDISFAVWDPGSYGDWGLEWDYVNASGEDIGDGAGNTQSILDALPTADTAAKRCADYSYGGYNDWFLPTGAALQAMYSAGDTLEAAQLTIGVYWTSTEYPSDSSLAYDFQAGSIGYANKGATYRIRPMRIFE